MWRFAIQCPASSLRHQHCNCCRNERAEGLHEILPALCIAIVERDLRPCSESSHSMRAVSDMSSLKNGGEKRSRIVVFSSDTCGGVKLL